MARCGGDDIVQKADGFADHILTSRRNNPGANVHLSMQHCSSSGQGYPQCPGRCFDYESEKPYTDLPMSPVRERQSVGIYADWMPLPSSFGEYDRYEGFAQIPGEISWRFKMYPVKEDAPSWFGGTPWAGKFDEISLELPANTQVQVRLSDSKTQRLGPAVLQNTLSGCRS
ncbi:hypothetical protein QKW52_28820 [Bacillus sonorensis]|nr:hypothetical protein [Bacillus sonorensis]